MFRQASVAIRHYLCHTKPPLAEHLITNQMGASHSFIDAKFKRQVSSSSSSFVLKRMFSGFKSFSSVPHMCDTPIRSGTGCSTLLPAISASTSTTPQIAKQYQNVEQQQQQQQHNPPVKGVSSSSTTCKVQQTYLYTEYKKILYATCLGIENRISANYFLGACMTICPGGLIVVDHIAGSGFGMMNVGIIGLLSALWSYAIWDQKKASKIYAFYSMYEVLQSANNTTNFVNMSPTQYVNMLNTQASTYILGVVSKNSPYAAAMTSSSSSSSSTLPPPVFFELIPSSTEGKQDSTNDTNALSSCNNNESTLINKKVE
jgi:hypothetical protein